MVCRFASILGVLAVLVFSQGAAAAVYKWVDENGKVHYSDKPPADNATEMDVETGGDSSGPTLTETQRKAKQQRLLEAFEKERQDKQAAEAQAKKEKQEREAWCRRAREELAQMRSAGYLYEYDDDGNKVILSDEGRAQATREYQREIDKYC